MEFVVHYWRANLESFTGHEHGAVIDELDIVAMLNEKKVNLMIHHCAAIGDNAPVSYCYIDDLNHRFQPRAR